MYTNRTVHVIPETENISNAISIAAKLWPEIEAHPEMLLGKILDIGIAEIESLSMSNNCNRLDEIDKIAGTMDDVWPTNWRDELREDWPA